jgi:hypothetical protein
VKKSFASVVATLAVAAGFVAFAAAPANALLPVEPCVPQPAHEITVNLPGITAQEEVSHIEYTRYSWIGGATKTAPTEAAPSANWQLNTATYDPKSKEPIGVAFKGTGKSSWFFWTATKVIDKPYVEAVPPSSYTLTLPAVECPDGQTTDMTIATDPVVETL